MSINKDLLDRIHGCDIYANFPANNFKIDLNDWQSRHPFFEDYITRHRPKLILELGTWKGGSAVYMAELVKKLGLTCPIICIDTWLGHWAWWADKKIGTWNSATGKLDETMTLWNDINTRNGFPMVYFQFLANVVLTDNKDIIVPLPQTTTHGMAMLKHMQIRPDMIYVDADHEYAPVYSDIVDAYDLLLPGGVMLGDDYNNDYPSVIKAVDQFVAENSLALQTYAPNKWVVIKPA
jgi:hypothetical protein